MPENRGRFITFEGGEGTGKSTQLRLLSDYLSSRHIRNIRTKEPGGTPVGLELRKLLVCGDKNKFDPIAEALLYYADRRVHLIDKIWPALKNGEWVLSDRFADSTMAYQYYGYDKRVPKETLEQLYAMTVGDFHPDLTVILDIDPQKGLARSLKRNGSAAEQEIRFESRELAFHENLRRGFLEIAESAPRYAVLDADKSVDELHREIVKITEERLMHK